LAANCKKRGAERAHIVLIDETGVLLNPLVRRTLAPRGQTPTLPVFAGHRHKLSVIAALSLSPITRQPGLYFEVAPHRHFRSLDVADFIRDLLRHLRGRVIVVCDNGTMHKGEPIRQLLADHPRLSIEHLPPYAPDLNPVEQLWNHLKYGALANFVPHDLDELDDRVLEWLVEAKFNRDRLRSCYKKTPLYETIRKLAC
jgi:putative transposase